MARARHYNAFPVLIAPAIKGFGLHQGGTGAVPSGAAGTAAGPPNESTPFVAVSIVPSFELLVPSFVLKNRVGTGIAA